MSLHSFVRYHYGDNSQINPYIILNIINSNDIVYMNNKQPFGAFNINITNNTDNNDNTDNNNNNDNSDNNNINQTQLIKIPYSGLDILTMKESNINIISMIFYFNDLNYGCDTSGNNYNGGLLWSPYNGLIFGNRNIYNTNNTNNINNIIKLGYDINNRIAYIYYYPIISPVPGAQILTIQIYFTSNLNNQKTMNKMQIRLIHTNNVQYIEVRINTIDNNLLVPEKWSFMQASTLLTLGNNTSFIYKSDAHGKNWVILNNSYVDI